MHSLQLVDVEQLATAYAAARYAVRLDGDMLLLKVGQPAIDLEAYWPAARYAFITAWNPASEPLSDTANQTADTMLVTQIDATGASRQPAWAGNDDGGWREDGWLVADLDDQVLNLLAREFGQAGVLVWERGQPVRLRMMVAQPGTKAGGESIEWAGR